MIGQPRLSKPFNEYTPEQQKLIESSMNKFVALARAKHFKTDLSVTPKVVGEESKPV